MQIARLGLSSAASRDQVAPVSARRLPALMAGRARSRTASAVHLDHALEPRRIMAQRACAELFEARRLFPLSRPSAPDWTALRAGCLHSSPGQVRRARPIAAKRLDPGGP